MCRSAQTGFSPLCNVTPAAGCEASGSAGSCGCRAGAGPDPLAGLCQEVPRADLALGKAGTFRPSTEPLGPSHRHLWQVTCEVSETFLRNNCNVKMDAVVVRARTRRFGLCGGCVGWLTQGEPSVFWIILGWEQEESEVGTAPFVHFHVICEVNLCPGKAFVFHAPWDFPSWLVLIFECWAFSSRKPPALLCRFLISDCLFPPQTLFLQQFFAVVSLLSWI